MSLSNVKLKPNVLYDEMNFELLWLVGDSNKSSPLVMFFWLLQDI